MGVKILAIEDELYESVNQYREGLGMNWKEVFNLIKLNLKADLKVHGNGSDKGPVSNSDGIQCVTQIDREKAEMVDDGDIVISTFSELESIKSEEREKGYEEGWTECMQKRDMWGLDLVVDFSLCRCCKSSDADSLHHIIPRSHGGSDELDNKIPLCDPCHNRVEVLTEKLIENKGVRQVDVIRGYIEGEFPVGVYE